MKKIVLLLLIIGASIYPIEAQTNTESHYRFHTNYTFLLGNYHRAIYDKAIEYCDSIKESKYLDNTHFFLMAKIYACGFDYFKTIEYLEKAVKTGTTLTQIEHSYDLDPFRENNMYIPIEINYEKWHEEYLKKEQNIQLDSNYIKQIIPFNEIYDDARYHLHARRKGDSTYFPSDSITRQHARKQIDSLFYEMIDLVIENGFPTNKRIGKRMNGNYYSFSKRFIYEIPDSFSLENPKWLIIKDMISNEMKNGNLKPFFYASFLDQYRLSKKEPQLYGTINYVYNYNFINYLEYEKPEEINIRRRNVGLCSIQLKLWLSAQDLPPQLQNIKFK